jgi:hypothetical protein
MFRATHRPSSGAQKLIAAYGFTASELLMMVVGRPKLVEQLRNIGIINSTTRLYLVGSFYEIYVTMHGSMNIKLEYHLIN